MEPFCFFCLLGSECTIFAKLNPIEKTTMKFASSYSRKLFVAGFTVFATGSVAFAQGEMATGTVSGILSGGSYDYTITLDNISGSVPIGGFWYSWTPTISPFFYLPSVPTSSSAPTGWSSFVDGNSIQFGANTPGNALAPGNSIEFHYVASFSPSQLTGDAGYSYVYSGGIEGDPGAFVNVVTVPAPEPSSRVLLTIASFGLVFASHRQLRKPTVAV